LVDFDRAVERRGRGSKRNKEPVSRMCDLLASVSEEQRANGAIVPSARADPRVVADSREYIRGLDDVGEHEGSRENGRIRGLNVSPVWKCLSCAAGVQTRA
jgi:hypothetical protein